MTGRQALLVSLTVLVALVAVYGPHVQSAPFVYEDHRAVDGMDRPFSVAGLRVGRGLTTESWTVIRTPIASHALNLSLHLIVVLLTGFLCWQFTGRLFVAVGAASILALHPLAVEGVAYAVSRAELIAAVWVLLALVCVTASMAWAWACLPALIGLAYLGKESGLVVLGLIPLVLWLKGERLWAARGAWVCVGLAVTALTVAATQVAGVMAFAEYGVQRIDPDVWMAQQAVALWRLVILSVAPFWLSVSPDVEAVPVLGQIGAAILLIGLGEIAWRVRHVAPLVTGGLIGIAVVVAPRFLLRTPGSPLNEHQYYLALPWVACVWIGALEALSVRWEPCRA